MSEIADISPRSATPPWVFAIFGQVDGLTAGFTAIVLPYIAVQKGMSVAAIGAIIGTYALANQAKLLWSPILVM